MKCESFMVFQKVEKPGEDSLGVMFECASCGNRVAMVTNPGETQMVSALGVKLGGRTEAAEPFELTRSSMKETAMEQQVRAESAPMKSAASPAVAEAVAESAGKCPFSSMISGMKEGNAPSKLTWSPEAEERMSKIPDFVKPMVKSGIEAFAKKNGYQVVTPAVIDESKNDQDGFEWTPGATQRLENIPSFIRPLAKKEIERLALERGTRTISEETLEEAKVKFGQFMTM